MTQQLREAMKLLMDTFDNYAAAEGKKDTLTKAEAKSLLEKELPDLLEVAEKHGGVDKVLKELDENADSEIDFDEFVTNIAILTNAFHYIRHKK